MLLGRAEQQGLSVSGMGDSKKGDGNARYTKSSQAQFNQYVSELVTAKWVGVNGEAVRNTRK